MRAGPGSFLRAEHPGQLPGGYLLVNIGNSSRGLHPDFRISRRHTQRRKSGCVDRWCSNVLAPPLEGPLGPDMVPACVGPGDFLIYVPIERLLAPSHSITTI